MYQRKRECTSSSEISQLRVFFANLPALTRNLQNYRDKDVDQHDKKNTRHPTAPTCGFCFTAVVGNNSFSKMYVHERCFV